MSSRRDPADTGEAFRGQGLLGTLMLVVGVGLAVLAVGEKTAGLPFPMPRSWYVNPALWYLVALASFVGGVAVLRHVGERGDSGWRPERPGRRFERVVLYTRAGCHLCDVAADVLAKYRDWLPETEEVDVDADPVLRERFGSEIPVVECDGQVRFRGRVDELLLRRLIEGTTPR